MILTHGDLLQAETKVIAHQVNCKGVMGAGIAGQIKSKYPIAYEMYKEYVWDRDGDVLGTVCLSPRNMEGIILHIFGQENFGRERGKCYTNYDAVKSAFIAAIKELRDGGYRMYGQIPIGIPYGLGCGLAGGDWDKMKELLEDIEKEWNVLFIAYKVN